MRTRSGIPLIMEPGRVVVGHGEVTYPNHLTIRTDTVRPGKRYTFTIKGEPMGKPRMTRRDKWAKRKCVTDYWTWADTARAAFGKVDKLVLTQPTTLSIVAYFSIPESWSRYKKDQAKNMPHTVKPDGDNVMKALKDALFYNDQMVVDGWYRKLYDDGRGPRIEVTIDA